MLNTVFLSAGVPDPRRGPDYAKTADPVAIAAAVSALLFVTLGRRRLVWGGQPAITAIVRAAVEDMNVDFGSWVQLYQSEFFKDDYPEENERFRNVTYTPAVHGDMSASLLRMRELMFGENAISAAVFIGGMKGIMDEFELIRDLCPSAMMVPISSTGGATRHVADRLGVVDARLAEDLDYVSVFQCKLGIDGRERRYRSFEDQPADIKDRLRTGSPAAFKAS